MNKVALDEKLLRKIEKTKILEYAKFCYLIRDSISPDKRAYSFQSIASLIKHQFNKNVSAEWVRLNAIKLKWDEDWELMKQGIIEKIDFERLQKNFEKNITGMLSFTYQLEEYLKDLLANKKLTPRIAADIYTQLVYQHTKIMETKYKLEEEKNKKQIEDDKVQTGFMSLVDDIAKELSKDFDLIPKKKQEDLMIADYTIVEKEKNENSD